jgi:hypothetical protein
VENRIERLSNDQADEHKTWTNPVKVTVKP